MGHVRNFPVFFGIMRSRTQCRGEHFEGAGKQNLKNQHDERLQVEAARQERLGSGS
jgi:hypothetical protein